MVAGPMVIIIGCIVIQFIVSFGLWFLSYYAQR